MEIILENKEGPGVGIIEKETDTLIPSARKGKVYIVVQP